jgi:4-hydroxy-3-polyprenylbenzoate decarboxylase
MRIIIGLTGASGSIFGVEFLKRCEGEKYLITSRWGKSVLAQETKLSLEDLTPYTKKVFSNEDLSSPFASGSNAFDAMVIVPCSASTLAKIACGIADSLLTRAAAVALKERRKLILCLRETPLSTILLEQMHKLSQAGAILMPISPSFYQNAGTVEELAKLFSERICRLLGSETPVTGWKTEAL